MSGYVASYHSALRRGDPEACVERFEPDGYAREPAGTRHEGHPNLLRFYRKLRSEAGGVELHHLNVIDDGVRCVLEYNVIAWGGALLPPQAGVAVYERGQSGKLAAARIYDDVAPPPEIYAERD
ncbi:MAG: nuclear transport factor 2 family protein [Hyphomonadaceae bacterium]|nr:nuclear transport factor 2 family protein [Hyphomonadaceae bacterium]